MNNYQRAALWTVRFCWAVAPIATGPAFAAALDGWDPAVRTAASVGLWAVWALALLASLVAHPVALTAVRVVMPAGLAATVAAAAGGHPSVPVAAVAAALAFAPHFGGWFVNGPAYPNERRLALRPPGHLVAGPVVLAWAVVVSAPTAAVLLLAGRQWAAGAAVSVVGLPLAAVLARSLHSLSRRWVVFVPAGLVLHDPMTLADPVLFATKQIETLRAASAGTDSLDLTQRALGLALELVLTEKVPMVLRVGRGGTEAGSSARLLFTPTQPATVLAEAAARRIAV